MIELQFIPKTEFDRVRTADVEPDVRLALADSGHLGSSFSAMDIVVHLSRRS